ncbi:hypothetical protein Zmor_011171 [Zophobas morio]|uniref:C2H2-type domain-containing protein n=1 Tax=Zophobas morio TaxID=2755281 RepID=A0AA38MKN8_9CUCU|nr:hypothetical protein Zmor_026638 [Zophobas morio]KAJ3659483.1 hypothetical protein Zmor_011171 [Zophobas morio]
MDSNSEASVQEKPFKCKVVGCIASFSKNRKLVNHLKRHSGERPFACDEEGCDKTYTNSSHLQRHKKNSHGPKTETERVMCNYDGCGTTFANMYSLKKHCTRKHNSEHYPFKCGECSQGFDRKKQLQHHMYLHTGEAMFSCDKCNMKFTTNYYLNKHKRHHRDYYCDCGEVFYRWSLLLAHRKICHKKQYACDICDKVFSEERNMKNHKLIHVDQSQRKVFVCGYPDCKRFFFYKRNLKYHIENFHQKINAHKTFKCTYPKCQVVLKTKQSRRQHLERHFKWKMNKKRKIRRDKGQAKKSISSRLIVRGTLQEIHERVTSEQNEAESSSTQEQVCLVQDVAEEDDPILKQCQVVLKLLNEKLVNAS